MKVTSPQLALIILFSGGLLISARAVDTPAAIAQIRQIAKEDAQSYEQLLAKSAAIAQSAWKDKQWVEVEKAVTSAGLKLVFIKGQGTYAEYRCVLLPNAVATKGGFAMDLYLEFCIAGGKANPADAMPSDYTVTQANVGLSAIPLAKCEQAENEKWFGAGKVVQEALESWPVRDARPDYPVLEGVDISFGHIWNDVVYDGQGYRVRLDLVKGKDDRQHRRQLDCSAVMPQDRAKRRAPIMDWLSRDFSPRESGLKLAEDLRRLVQAKEPSYQQLLRKATHIVQKAIRDREWSAVAPELKGQNLKLLHEYRTDFGMQRQYLVAEKAWTTASGQTMDLYVEVGTWRKASKDTPTREMVSEAHAGLHAKVELPGAKVVNDGHFGHGTAIHKALLDEDVLRFAGKNTFLDTVEVYYDVVVDRWQSSHSWGFHVQPIFIRAKGDTTAFARVYVSVPSALDLRRRSDAAVLVKGFAPTDTLDEPQCHGANSSEPDVHKGK